MYCKNCGSKISDDATFCSNCGYNNSTTSYKKINIKIILPILLLVIASFFVFKIISSIINNPVSSCEKELEEAINKIQKYEYVEVANDYVDWNNLSSEFGDINKETSIKAFQSLMKDSNIGYMSSFSTFLQNDIANNDICFTDISIKKIEKIDKTECSVNINLCMPSAEIIDDEKTRQLFIGLIIKNYSPQILNSVIDNKYIDSNFDLENELKNYQQYYKKLDSRYKENIEVDLIAKKYGDHWKFSISKNKAMIFAEKMIKCFIDYKNKLNSIMITF